MIVVANAGPFIALSNGTPPQGCRRVSRAEKYFGFRSRMGFEEAIDWYQANLAPEMAAKQLVEAV